MKNGFFLVLILALFSCANNPETENDQNVKAEELNTKSTEPIYEVLAVEVTGSGWGYQILRDGKLIIDQQQIPAIQGKQSFSSEDDALKTGELALKKIKGQNFPPTISIEELDSLGILK